jgi:phosphoglycerate dehydrogenase-like enzyme
MQHVIVPRRERMPHKVVISRLPDRFERAIAALEGAGCEIVRLPVVPMGQTRDWTPDLVESYVRDADALLGTFAGMRLTRTVLAAGEKLRVVTSPVIGAEHIDVEACTDLGIVVGYGATPENYLGVAEAIVMLIAALRKQLPQKTDAVRGGGWRVGYPGRMVRGCTVGLIGLGNIGRATARRLAGWDCTILATDPYVSPAAAAEIGATLVDLDTLLRESDVVSVMVPLTDETRHLIGARELSLMKPDAYLINTARGGCVDEAALHDAVERGRIAGAAIDAWEDERPDGSSPLRRHPKVIGTAHNVGHSEEACDSLPVAAVENTLRGLRGEEPLYVRNAEVLPRWRERLERLGSRASIGTA